MPLNNKPKQITLRVSSIAREWLNLLSGLSGFTSREIDVLEVLLNKRDELVTAGIKQPYLSELLFSSQSRKEYEERLNISAYNLTNLFSSIRKKQGITMINEVEDLQPMLIPSTEIHIKFVKNNDTGAESKEEDSGEE